MDTIKFKDQDGKTKFILEGDNTEPVEVAENCSVTIKKPDEKEKE